MEDRMKHPATCNSRLMVVRLVRRKTKPASDGEGKRHHIVMRRIGPKETTEPADYKPPRGTVAYAYFWEHHFTVRTPQGKAAAYTVQPVGSLFTSRARWPDTALFLSDCSDGREIFAEEHPAAFLLVTDRNPAAVRIRRMS